MTIEQLFQEGIKALQAGRIEAAVKFFAQIVKTDPNSEEGWLMLAKCVPEANQREYCFKRVLGLNPNNLEARLGLKRNVQPQPAQSREFIPPAGEMPIFPALSPRNQSLLQTQNPKFHLLFWTKKKRFLLRIRNSSLLRPSFQIDENQVETIT